MTHSGYDQSGEFPSDHIGEQKDCPAPECIDRATEGKVPEGWGVWCEHDVQVVVADPASEDLRFPDALIVEPWPCGQCTRAEFDEEVEWVAAEIADFEISFE